MGRTAVAGLLFAVLWSIAFAPAAQSAPKKKKPAAKPVLAAPTLKRAPPIDDPARRMAWAVEEIARHRELLQAGPNPGARVNLGKIAIEASRDIERALAHSDIATAAAFRELFAKQLADTRWRLNWLAERDTPGGDFALGVLFQHGILEERSTDEACRRFAAAWDKGFLEAAYRHAHCVETKQPAEALSLLQTAADGGHAAASEQLGRRCLEARPPDGTCAAARLEAAAAAGRPSAKSLLGWLHAQGIGKPRDPARALALYNEAAAAGDLSAKNNLGELHESGRGVPQDARRALGFYREAAQAGFAPAQFNLGRLYAGGGGVERDAAEARKWLQSALKGGVQGAQQLLDWLNQQEPQK